MGLLKAGLGAAAGVLSEQWRDYIYCDAIPNNVLMVKGRKRTGGSDNLLTNGSIIAVNEGQCMLIVHQGAIVDVCAEAGEFLFDSGAEPSVFYGDLGEQVKATFLRIGERISFGGDAANDLRVYFVNTKEIMGNKYGTPAPVTVRVVDANIGLDTDIGCRCNGEYSFRIVDPLLFYTQVAGNVTDAFRLEQISSQMRSEFLTALQPGFGRLSAMGIRFSLFPAHTTELAEAMEQELSVKWTQRRGIAVVAVGINTIAALPEDEERIKQLQLTAVMRDPNMRAANAAIAQGEALKAAASNEAGAMMGFAGINMMQGAAGAMNASGLYDTSQPYQQPTNAYQVTSPAEGWTCPSCGTTNTSKFCMECGSPKPAPAAAWTCPNCGASNTGKFCSECGTPKPVDETWTCPKCGASNKGKFCMECGTPRA
jgi:membrane protease subunit (stomatin/prohibitin family)